MKIKLGDLVAKKTALEQLMETKVSGIAAFKLAKDIRVINEELITFDKTNNDLIKKYGTEQEDGTFKIAFNTPEFEKYDEEVTPVVEQELDLPIQTVTLQELGTDFQLEPKFMDALIDFIIVE